MNPKFAHLDHFSAIVAEAALADATTINVQRHGAVWRAWRNENHWDCVCRFDARRGCPVRPANPAAAAARLEATFVGMTRDAMRRKSIQGRVVVLPPVA